MADKMTKFCMDIYRKFEKSKVLKIIADLQIPNILERTKITNSNQSHKSYRKYKSEIPVYKY
jgi:hypothetical protein